MSGKLWVETPLVYSSSISTRLGCDVYLKLETLQPSQSFKSRGISLFAQRAVVKHGPGVHLLAASGGNAGLAVAYAARALNVRCTIFIPAAAASVKPVLEREKAEVVVGGEAYVDALRAAEETLAKEDNAVLVPAYDDATLWEGHSSMIEEISRQLPDGQRPSTILCSVGGAGLIGGVLTGCNALGWDDVRVVAMETFGADCFHLSMLSNPSFAPHTTQTREPFPAGVTVAPSGDANNVTIATLPRVTSRAASLGASSASSGVVKMALDRGNVLCVCVKDEMSMAAGLFFTEEHKLITELACSTTLVPAYSPSLFARIRPDAAADRPVVFIVCGGVKISLKEIEEYQAIVASKAVPSEVMIDGVMYNAED